MLWTLFIIFFLWVFYVLLLILLLFIVTSNGEDPLLLCTSIRYWWFLGMTLLNLFIILIINIKVNLRFFPFFHLLLLFKGLLLELLTFIIWVENHLNIFSLKKALHSIQVFIEHHIIKGWIVLYGLLIESEQSLNSGEWEVIVQSFLIDLNVFLDLFNIHLGYSFLSHLTLLDLGLILDILFNAYSHILHVGYECRQAIFILGY